MSVTILKNVRLSFPDLFEAKAFKDSAPAFSATFLVPKNSPAGKQIEKDYFACATAKWGQKAKAVVDSIKGNSNRFCVQDGDLSDYDGYAGMWAVRAKSKTRPIVTDRDKTPLVQADGKPYSGCYVNASIEFFAYDNPGKGISANLRAVAFFKDGDAFSGGTKVTDDELDNLADGADADADDLA